ncbi:beta-ketoacyl synthase N-terminal-like domain-containing protein [Cognatiyoonia sp. IB215446]|uniref:beta-ketoacyl synthase N-terminal-like domain-containing protein n=1 Tax=Cognatiyoonia sp. IB215446 TaxID=3097355 RepID=UPI002A159A5A|nr:beta-ketoacyl synthase N-terminal-like domain-containing protein [Cognatiyoonia sp. IB215446]MDX8350500.1 beta-ketoacyl synthase N-terminal-like domain-containing protein [Cognatiyoonia sp. IB215446]
MIDRFGEPMKVTLDPGLDMAVTGVARLTEMATAAAQEAIRPILEARTKPSICIAFSTGEERPGQGPEVAAQVATGLQRTLGDVITITKVVHWMGGHSGGIAAMQAALNLLDRDGIDIVLAGGVESYLNAETLEWLDDIEQLHSNNNLYGFCPGEAAGFVALTRANMAKRLGIRPLLGLLSAGSGQEKNLIKTEDIVLGEGLSDAFKNAAVDLPEGAQIDRIICDMNGERYRGNEYGFAALKTSGLFRDAADFEAPADCWGDLGAASGPLYTAIVIEAEARGYAKGPLSMIWASSEAGRRDAAILSRVGAM